jgi:hypothetical protein
MRITDKNDIGSIVAAFVVRKSRLPILAEWFAKSARAVCTGNRHFPLTIVAQRYSDSVREYRYRATVTLWVEGGENITRRLKIKYVKGGKVTAKLAEPFAKRGSKL